MNMINWKVTNIRGGDTLGERLLEARSVLGITHSVIFKQHSIPISFLESIESGNYGKLPEKVYARAFLKKYLSILALPINEHLILFEEEYTTWQRLTKNERAPIHSIREKKISSFELTPLFWQKAGVVAVGLVFFIYIGMRVDASIAPVTLNVISPRDQLATSEQNLVIEGQTETEATITINDQEIPIDNEGKFSKSVSLEEGLNTLEITASKKYRPETTSIRHILVTNES